MSPRSLPLFVLALLAAPVRAEFAAYDFRHTQCADAGGLVRAGFEPRDSEWSGGGPSTGVDAGPLGATSLLVAVPDSGETREVLLHVPAGYRADSPAPLVVVLHGAAGSAAAAPSAAAAVRTLWTVLAEREGAIVLAPIAGGSQGGWVPVRDAPAIACALAEVERRYAVDRDRRYLWGFSAGGHFGHALALGNAGRFAAYAVNAGALQALACSAAAGADDCAVQLPQALRSIPVSLRVGTSDPLRGYVQADYGRFQSAGWDSPALLAYAEFGAGHTYTVADAEAAWAWFAARRLSH